MVSITDAPVRTGTSPIGGFAASNPRRQPVASLVGAAQAALPKIEHGQLWLIETAPGGVALSPFARQALTGANVVIYDRSLAPAVAGSLPLGGYAEPAGRVGADERCVRFVRDGWSVVRLVAGPLSSRQRGLLVRRLARRLLSAQAPAELPVWVVDDAAQEAGKTRLDRVADTAETEGALGIVFAAVGSVPRLHAVGCNGLAG